MDTVLAGLHFEEIGLRRQIEQELGKELGESVSREDLKNLQEVKAEGLGIQDISGLKFASNLTKLNLADNQITDISPLVENQGLSGNIVLTGNPLSNTSITTFIPILQNQGISVEYDKLENIDEFKSWNLEYAIRQKLGITAGLLTKEDLEKLTNLDASNKKTSDLTGLEYCVNLTKLNLRTNEIPA